MVVLEGITATEYAVYQGLYQGMAWQQGWEDRPVRFRLPDDSLSIGEYGTEGYTEGFDLLKFFRVVEDMDNEGHIHSWQVVHDIAQWGPETFVILTCTEDDSQLKEGYDEANSGHASWHIDRLTKEEG
jgi:hypothetical protein